MASRGVLQWIKSMISTIAPKKRGRSTSMGQSASEKPASMPFCKWEIYAGMVKGGRSEEEQRKLLIFVEEHIQEVRRYAVFYSREENNYSQSRKHLLPSKSAN